MLHKNEKLKCIVYVINCFLLIFKFTSLFLKYVSTGFFFVSVKCDVMMLVIF
jgi:hypothetical protein